jgi:hypothetical protein
MFVSAVSRARLSGQRDGPSGCLDPNLPGIRKMRSRLTAMISFGLTPSRYMIFPAPRHMSQAVSFCFQPMLDASYHKEEFMKRVKIILFCALATLSLIAHAVQQTAWGRLTVLQIYQDHSGTLVRHTNMLDPDSCGRQDWMILPVTHPHYKAAYALLLSAHLNRTSIALTVSGCHEGIPKIIHVTTSQDT